MTLAGTQLFNHLKKVEAFTVQTVSNTSVNGTAITNPARWGRGLLLVVMASAFPATTDVTIAIEAQKKADGLWEALNIKGTSTPLTFTPTLFDDGGAGEGVTTLGDLDLADIDWETYKAIRVVVANAVATAAIIGVCGFIHDLYNIPSGDTDDLWAKARNSPA